MIHTWKIRVLLQFEDFEDEKNARQIRSFKGILQKY